MREAFGFDSRMLFAPVAPEVVEQGIVEPLRVEVRHDVRGATVEILLTRLEEASPARPAPAPAPRRSIARLP